MNLPALHGNWVDFVIIVFVLFYLWEGWGRGFFASLFALVTFVFAFTAALKLYPFAARLLVANFSFPQGLANAFGFFLIGLIFEQILAFVLSVVETLIPTKWLGHRLQEVLTLIPQFGNAVIIITFVLTLALGLPIRGDIKAAIAESKLGGGLVRHTQQLESAMSGVFGEAIADTINFITVNPVSHQSVQLNFTQRELAIDPDSENKMLALVNQERISRGLNALTNDVRLRDVARQYARDMFERGYFSHYNPEGQSPFDRMQEAGIDYVAAGENLALAPGVSIAHHGLMESPGHRENILSLEFSKVGIGVIDGGIYGKMFVQEFTD